MIFYFKKDEPYHAKKNLIFNSDLNPHYRTQLSLSLYNKDQYLLLINKKNMHTQESMFYKELIVFLYVSFKAAAFENRLQQQDMIGYKNRVIKPLFPQKIIQNEGQQVHIDYECSDICCQIDTGYFCCGGSQSASQEMIAFGLGINMYFKYVKYLISFFALATLLSIIPTFIYYQVSQENNLLAMDINSILFSSTIGSLTASGMNCVYGNNNVNQIFRPNCTVGTINMSSPVYSNNSIVNLKNCKNEITNSAQNINTLNPSQFQKKCTNLSCTVTITSTNTSQSNFISVPYSCNNPTYPILTLQISNSQILKAIVVCDLGIVVLFLFFYCIQGVSQKKDIDIFRKKSSTLNDFSLQIKGFKFGNNSNIARISNFIKGFRQNLEEKGIVDLDIVNFKVPDSIEKIGILQRKKQIYEKIYKIFEKEFFEKKFEIDKMKFDDFEKICDIPKFRSKIITLIQDFRKLNQKSTGQPYSIFITFSTNLEKEKVLKACKPFCFKKYLTIQNVEYQIKEAPIPDLIIWKNLDRNQRLRTLFSWFITILILVISYAIIAFAYGYKTKLISSYNFSVDCTLKYSNKSIYLTWNKQKSKDNTWINCYCSNNLIQINKYSQCISWFQSYTFYTLSPIFISVIIVVYNMLVSYIFRKLSQFESHKYFTEELYSYVIKRTLLLLLNTGLVILLINMKFNVDSRLSLAQFLFGGTYEDFTADWYYNIGIVILLTMLFNIFMPIVELLIEWAFKVLLQMFDKRCWTTESSKRTKSEYFELYSGMMFPIEQRYAQLLSIMFITFAYNQVIPLLNIIGFSSFFALLLTDKLLVFKFFRLKNYDQKLHIWIKNTALFSIVIHLVTSIFFLSQPTLTPDLYSNQYIQVITNSRFNYMASEIHIYPYVILLALLIVWFFFQNTIGRLVEFCTRKLTRLSYIRQHTLDFYQILSKTQIQQLLLMNENQIITYQHETDMEKKYISPQRNESIHNVQYTNIKVNQNASLMNLKEYDSIYNFTEKQQDLFAADKQNMEEYAKILCKFRQKLKSLSKKKDQKNLLLGMPGYDNLLAGDTYNIQKQLIDFEQKVQNYYFSSISSIDIKIIKQELPVVEKKQ